MSWFRPRLGRSFFRLGRRPRNTPGCRGRTLSFQVLEDRTVPDAGFGRLWLLQVDGVTGPGAQQLQQVQQRLNDAGAAAAAVRHLGLDGLVLVQTPTDQDYSVVQRTLSRVAGFSLVRADSLGETPLRRSVNCNKAHVAALLVARGGDAHSTGSKGLTPLLAARTSEMKQVLRSRVDEPTAS